MCSTNNKCYRSSTLAFILKEIFLLKNSMDPIDFCVLNHLRINQGTNFVCLR